MSTNGISTHTPKSERRDLKLAVAETKRQAGGNTAKPYYRPYNVYTPPGTVSPAEGHPWTKS
ncbi:hypothetical protein UFOVP1636_3 [uncultured Caudovirales phage]|uniref:Uncharacterized protein n=1 Tax=uncultured Caudovirales phage TaxID=2100421 RepID=A0A6J5SZY4_9CAUD|nr:hypothetical protein UFOVP1636_3 [uncultured Caudovirales phage]